MKNITKILTAGVLLLCGACTHADDISTPGAAEQPATPAPDREEFACGADVSWITELEHKGYTFSNADGVEKECMELLRDDCGVNAIRLRVWVNPVEGWNNISDVAIKARRANNLGLRLMIDFHFSDIWADPGAQVTPAAWQDLDLAGLKSAMTGHINDMLTTLRDMDIEPEWIQIGNETRGGMMYPLGAADAHFAELVDAGHEAVKAIFPEAKTIVHIDCGDQLGLYTYIFDILKAAGTRYDMIGMSLYPDPSIWQTTVNKCIENVKTLNTMYGKRLVISEIGMDYREEDAADGMMHAMVKGCVDSGVVDGIFWWEPESPAAEGYMKGCFKENTPTKALDAFKEMKK